MSWLEREMSGAKWTLVNYSDRCDTAEGETFWVDIKGLGVVTIESWATSSSAGVDVYSPQGKAINFELSEFLGDEDFEYLTTDWIYNVSAEYWTEMGRLGYEAMVEKAKVAARKVLPQHN